MWHDKNDTDNSYSQICSRGNSAHQIINIKEKKENHDYHKHNSRNLIFTRELLLYIDAKRSLNSATGGTGSVG